MNVDSVKLAARYNQLMMMGDGVVLSERRQLVESPIACRVEAGELLVQILCHLEKLHVLPLLSQYMYMCELFQFTFF